MRTRRRSVVHGCLHFLTGAALALALGAAADCGMGTASAAVPQPPILAPAAPTPQAASASDEAIASPAAGDAGSATRRQAIGPDPGAGYVRLPGHVLDALSRATSDDAGAAAKREPVTLTLVLKREDQAGFDRYLNDVYDSQSKNFRHFLPQAQIAERFGPSRKSYGQVLTYLQKQGFHIIRGSKNRLTLTASGKRRDAERAFRLTIKDYKLGAASFYANVNDPALPANIALRIFAIDGLSTLATARPAKQTLINKCKSLNWGITNPKQLAAKRQACIQFALSLVAELKSISCGPLGITCALADFILVNYNLISSYITFATSGVKGTNATSAKAMSRPRAASDGTGQTIGLVEFDGFSASDVSGYLAIIGAPASLINQLSVVPVNGGVAAAGAGEGEVLLDIDTVLSMAPGAKVVVYEAPFSGHASDYATLFNAMINGGVTVISNSWASCEDQVSLAEAQSIDTVLQSAAASGISVFNGSGDAGSSCLDGSANTISVPADSPSATAVGGSSLPQGVGPGLTYAGETWWDGSSDTPSTGQGGYGVSKFFSRPGYQTGLTSSAMRSVPDVVAVADPEDGVSICQADDGGCPNGLLTGGTSLAAPEWAAIAAVVNQAQGKNLGSYNAVLYPLAATDAFHNAASMGSDFAHVGLGSPNINVLNRLLKGETVGVPDAAASQVTALILPASATVGSDNSVAVPADGTPQGGVLVTLVDASGHTVSGKTITLTANSANAVITPASGVSSVSNGSVAFSVADLTAEALTFTATDTTDGIVLPTVNLAFGVPPAASAGISANPPSVAADGQSTATITVTLKDALNRPTPGKTVSISDGGAHTVLTGPAAGVTDANGQIQFSATDQVNESVTFTAADVTDSDLPVPGSGVVDYSGSNSTACGVGVAPVGGTGYTITPFMTGLPAAASLFYNNVNEGCPGATNPAFPPSGIVLAADFLNGNIYRTGLSGGAVSSTNILTTISPLLSNLTFGKDGSLYATLGSTGASIVQLNPATGAVMRTVASGLTCPTGLSVDPLSGDLFFDDDCTGGGLDNASIFRVIDPAGTDAARPTSVVVYATLPATANGAMAFAPNGTLYAVSGYYGNINAPVEQISATNAATVTVAPVAGITSDFAVAIGSTNADGSAQSLIVEPAGVLSEVPIDSPGSATVLATGSPGVGVTGPDGCLYSAKYDSIYRLANANGSCAFAPTSPAPSLYLTPAAVAAKPAQGSTQTFKATLHNVSAMSGVPVNFVVTGVNAQLQRVITDADGSATFAYTGLLSGSDSISAGAAANATSLSSNTVQLTWGAGKDVTFLAFNSGPQGGTVNQPVSVVASLSDVSVSPTAAVPAQTVSFAMGTAACTATTDSHGNASCSLTPPQAGTMTLSATFAGTSQWAASSAHSGFNVSAGAATAPTVKISVSPSAVAAGAAATLTWSSANATSCTASGAWSGTEPTSGTQSVTPAAIGSYTYTLTCVGAGGTVAASAVLSANLVSITVTAKSGGGAFGWPLSLLMGLLALVRFRSPRAVRGTLLCAVVAAAAIGGARADQTADAAPQTDAFIDHLYVGIRVGSMPLRLDSAKLDRGLAALGYESVQSTADTSAIGGTAYVGYELSPQAGVEFGYTHRNSTVATLSGTLPSSANVAPLLQDTTGLLRGYGDLFSVSFRGRLEVAPRFSIDPRIGLFFWDTKVTAESAGDRISATHQGGGVTAGVGAAYRLWRGLELGLGADYFRGSPNNVATLYSGSLEWRFGRN